MFSVLNDAADRSVFIAAVSPKEEELNVRAKATRRCNRPDGYNRMFVRDGVLGMRLFFKRNLSLTVDFCSFHHELKLGRRSLHPKSVRSRYVLEIRRSLLKSHRFPGIVVLYEDKPFYACLWRGEK